MAGNDAIDKDPNLEYRRKLGSGGFGTVHELFARKLLHIPSIDERVLQREVQAIKTLCGPETHANIVQVLSHGIMSNPVLYHIDMELCDLSLHDFIHCKTPQNGPEPILSFKRGSEVQLWNIMSHIASGVEYVHSQGQVHRDIKPRNVLYSRRCLTWKLADFGLTVEGSSNTEHSTRYGMGSSGYRAPELMSDSGRRYTNKVDIWAMGCILFELGTGKRVFNDDWAVFQYQSGSKFENIILNDKFDLPSAEAITNHIVNMLKIEPSARPSALALSQDFIQQLRTAQPFENPDLLRAHIAKVSLCLTIKTKSLEKVRMLLDTGADVNEKAQNGDPAVALAITYGCTDIALLLLERGADANANLRGSLANPLQMASYHGNKRLVRLLLDSGADINARGGYYGSALQAAVCGFPDKISKELLSLFSFKSTDRNIGGGYYDIALQAAATDRDRDAVIQLLLNSGAHVNAQGGKYGNALQAASTLGHTSAVRLLLEKGADVNGPGGPYKTALLAARTRGHKDIVQLLIRRGRSGRNRSSRPKSD